MRNRSGSESDKVDPIDMGRLLAARDHLDNAKDSLRRMECPSRVEDFTSAFATFIASMRTYFSHLTQFCKQSPKLKVWFDRVKAENYDDELMYYLSQARDQIAHGNPVPVSYSWSCDMTDGTPMNLTSRSTLAVDLSPDLADTRVTVEFNLDAFVNARSKQKILPPKSHLGETFSGDAREACELCFKRLVRIFDTAWGIAETSV